MYHGRPPARPQRHHPYAVDRTSQLRHSTDGRERQSGGTVVGESGLRSSDTFPSIGSRQSLTEGQRREQAAADHTFCEASGVRRTDAEVESSQALKDQTDLFVLVGTILSNHKRSASLQTGSVVVRTGDHYRNLLRDGDVGGHSERR